MKGVVFTELLDMVEERFSPELLDELLTSVDLPSGGAYTSVGTYDHAEMLTLVGRLSELSGISPEDLQRVFGEHLFGRFASEYPAFFEGISSAQEFLLRIDDYIHVEVRKLYPDAELPSFECKRMGTGLEMLYSSQRPFTAFAEGLIKGCVKHFAEHFDIKVEDLSTEQTTKARFVLVAQ